MKKRTKVEIAFNIVIYLFIFYLLFGGVDFTLNLIWGG